MPSRNEAKVVKRIRTWLNKQPHSYFFKVHGATSQVTGISDLIGVWQGRFVAIEVKDPHNPGGATPRQLLFIGRVIKAGGTAFVARDLPTVKKRLNAQEEDEE